MAYTDFRLFLSRMAILSMEFGGGIEFYCLFSIVFYLIKIKNVARFMRGLLF